MHVSPSTQPAPHRPQCSSLLRLVSQPSDSSALQSARSISQCKVHAPREHTGKAPKGSGQTFPQVPQLSGSRSRFEHVPSQFVRPAGQAGSQLNPSRPGAQTCPAAHSTPSEHASRAQVAALPETASQPSLASPLQSPRPESHATISQVVPAHRPEAPEGLQATPQAPQFKSLSTSDTSQPFEGSPSQSANPSKHSPRPHPASSQAGRAFGRASHVSPQAVQFSIVPSSISHPFSASSSQSAKPSSHDSNAQLSAHMTLALGNASQTSPHAAQSLRVPRGVSQSGTSSQSARPGRQSRGTQSPLSHPQARPSSRTHSSSSVHPPDDGESRAISLGASIGASEAVSSATSVCASIGISPSRPPQENPNAQHPREKMKNREVTARRYRRLRDAIKQCCRSGAHGILVGHKCRTSRSRLRESRLMG